MTRNSTTTAAELLQEPYALRDEQIAAFREQGFIKLPGVLDERTIAAYRPALTQAVADAVAASGRYAQPVGSRGVYDQAFQQIMNLWVAHPQVQELVHSPRLARLATELLGTEGVRLYHDQALFKEPGGGYTPWHCDQVYWPMASELSVTAWIPLQAIGLDMGPLEFCAGSQHLLENRDLKIGEESEAAVDETVTLKQLPVVREPFALGEVSFHYGYTFHRAGPNRTDRMRAVMTVIYMDRDMRLRTQERSAGDARSWCPGVAEGAVIDSRLNPVLYP